MPYIPLEEVESSNIVSIGYHRQSQTLRIRFQGDRYYDYPMVPEAEYKLMMAAESKGKFLNTRIKPLYGHRTVREEALREPCCEHPGPDPTCTKECFPCREWCCPGPGPDLSGAVRLGMQTGANLAEAVRSLVEGRLDSCPHGDGDRDCEVSCECNCHVSQVPPAVPLTEDGEIDLDKIPNVTHLFPDEPDGLIDGRCRCCNNPIQITPEDAVKLCLLCFRSKGGDTDVPCTNDHTTEDSGWCRIRDEEVDEAEDNLTEVEADDKQPESD